MTINVIIRYQDITYAFAKEFAANKDEKNYVPMILHFLWVGKPIPERYLDAVIGFEAINTDFEVKVYKTKYFRLQLVQL